MALSGVRDISVIETPPENREPIETHVVERSDDVLREAIVREIDRGGQVYYVHNRVQGIEQEAHRLRELVPTARYVVAHGQMDDRKLERVMVEFADAEHDVLVCTTIIESGVDIPNVNTIVINRAGTLGLAQLYQLRGRVGRSAEKAYAYLLYTKEQHLTEQARKRLRAIFEASELGAGFKIAMHDLEIRGAGNLLGPEQSGNTSTVGFDLYSKQLARAIQEREGGATEEEEGVALPVAVDLPLHMYIPSDYVEHESPRLALYRRLAGVGDTATLDELDDEMRDRFGPLPQPVANLLFFVRVKVLAARAGLAGVALDETQLTLRGRDDTLFDRLALYRRFGMDARVVRGVLRVPRSRLGDDWQEILLTLLEETIAANTPARTGARTALAAGQA